MAIFSPTLTASQKAARETAAIYSDEFESLRSREQRRLQRFTDVESEYVAHRDPRAWESLPDYGRREIRQDASQVRRHHLEIPYTHAITQKHTFRTAGRMPDLGVPRRNSSPPERHRGDTIEKLLYASYGYSDAQLQLASGAHDCSLHGAVPFDIYWSVERQLPRFRALSPGGCIVIPGIESPHDFKAVYRFWNVSTASFRAEYKDFEFPGGEDISQIKGEDGKDGVQMVKRTDKKTTTLMAGRVLLSQEIHDYGFAPYIVVPNLGPIRELWGYSDYEFYRGITAYYQQLVSRQADVIRAAANGAYVDEGTGQAASKILSVLRTGGVLPSRKDGKVTPIQVADMPSFVETHLLMVRQALDDISVTPAAAWGSTRNATSGSDRALQVLPQVELTALKQIHWSAGLQRLNEMLLRMIEQKTIGKVTYTGNQTKGHKTTAFAITLDAARAETEEMMAADGSPITDDQGQTYQIPVNPKDLIAGDYGTEVVFNRRIDRDDPQFVMSELSRFQQGAQSLRTTLEHLGVESPEDEMLLIEQEAQRFPWLRQGMIALMEQQLNAQQNGGGDQNQPDPSQPSGDISGAMASIMGGGGGASGALTADAAHRSVQGSSNGGGRTAGSVPGTPYGAA